MTTETREQMITSLLAETEGHTPGEWVDLSVGTDEVAYIEDIEGNQFPLHEWGGDNTIDGKTALAAPIFRAEVIRLRVRVRELEEKCAELHQRWLYE